MLTDMRRGASGIKQTSWTPSRPARARRVLFCTRCLPPALRWVPRLARPLHKRVKPGLGKRFKRWHASCRQDHSTAWRAWKSNRKCKGGRRCQPCTGGKRTRPRTRRPRLQCVTPRVRNHQDEEAEPLLDNFKIMRCGTRSTPTQVDSWMRRSTRCKRACAHLRSMHRSGGPGLSGETKLSDRPAPAAKGAKRVQKRRKEPRRVPYTPFASVLITQSNTTRLNTVGRCNVCHRAAPTNAR